MKKLKFGSLDSSTIGLYINGAGAYNSPEKDLEYVSIPGRSGDLIYNNNRFSNIEVTYPACFMLDNFDENFQTLKKYLYTRKGYEKLEDDYNPGFFRMASIAQEIDVSKIDWVNNAGSFDLKFNCKPQLYLASSYPITGSGKVTVQDGESTTIVNQFTIPNGHSGGTSYYASFPARPFIRAYGAGSFTINNVTVTISSHNKEFIVIDCELMDCYYSSENMNQYVTLSKFPILDNRNNSVSVSGLTKIEIWPRFWTV